MANFLTAYEVVRKNEGGYRNAPQDAGGETYKGVSRKYNPTWPGWAIIDQYKKNGPIATGAIIQDDTLDKLVKNLFEAEYWKPNNLSSIINQSLANLCFDAIIQHGYAERKIINTALKTLNSSVILSDTLRQAAIDTMNSKPQESYNAIAAQRIKYIESLKNSLGIDFAGVLNRAKAFINKYSTGGGFLLIAGLFIVIIYINSKK